MIKWKQIEEYPIPDSNIKKIETKGRKDNQDGQLKFADSRSVKFDWSLQDKEEALAKDKAKEPEAPFLYIPSKMPEVLL